MTHVVMVRLDNSGDVLLAGPAVRAVAAGAQRVTLWCGPRGRNAAEALPGVDRVLCHGLPWIDPDPDPIERDGMLDLVDHLAGQAFDQGIVLTSFHQTPLPTALLLRMAGVPVLAATSVDYPGALLDVRHRIDDDVPEVVRSLSLVATLGYELPPGDDGRLRVRPPTVPNPVTAGAPYVVVHPGASVPARRWDPAHSRELVTALSGEGWRVVVTGGPGERELTSRVADRSRNSVVDLGGRTSWEELTAVLAGAAALVVGNTGPAHLAAAVGTPVVSLFAPTVPAVRWRPWKVAQVLLGDQDIDCAGCRARECPVPGHPCIDTVTPRQVVDAVAEIARPAPEGLSA